MPQLAHWFLAAAIVCIGSFALAADPQSMPPDRLSTIMAQLASDDFPTRTAAQKQLTAYDWRSLDTLHKAAAASADLEVKSRLNARVEEIEDQMAFSPPPFEIDLKNASLTQIIESLGPTATRVETRKPQAGETTYQLPQFKGSFADLVRELQRQHPVELTGGRDVIYFNQARDAMSFSDKGIVAHGWTSSHEKSFLMGFYVVVDPRVQICDCSPSIQKAEDEKGRPIIVTRVGGMNTPSAAWHQGLLVDAMPGSERVAIIKGTLKVTVVVRMETREVEQPEKHLNEPMALGKAGQLTVTRFDHSEDETMVMAGMGPDDEVIAAALDSGLIQSRAEMIVTGRVIDATGQMVNEMTPSSGGGTRGKGILKMPVRLILVAPVKTRTIEIPFEFRDLPLKESW